LRPFNPNTISKDSLVVMGISEQLANQIINYRSKVGPFMFKTDFSKLYHLPDSLYKVYEPYLLLPETNVPALESRLVEINSADSLQLIAVKGIGPFYAHKILEYRRKSGGYYSIDQLDEAFIVYGNTLEEKQQRMKEIKSRLQVNPSLIKTINISTATQKQLSQHPYINYKQSVAIIRIRDKNQVTGLDDLLEKSGFDNRMAEIMKHYLAWE
jgi:competence protein ComEA